MTDEFRNIVRIADTDLNGNKTIERSLTQIKGLNHRLAKSIAKIFLNNTKLEHNIKLGSIPKDKDELLTSIILNPAKYGIRNYMVNRANDRVTGENKHLINSDLDFALREDKMLLSRIKARRGLRLTLGLRVRGQKSHSNFRRGKGTLGVVRKASTPGKASK